MFDVQSLMKYLLEGLAVGFAMFLIPMRKMEWSDVILVGITAAATFAVLDIFTPLVAVGARQGTGFAIGFQQMGHGEEEAEIPQEIMATPEIQEVNMPQMMPEMTHEMIDSSVPEGFDGFLTRA